MLNDECLYFGEKWCPITGYNGKYLISTYGRVKSLLKGKETILKPDENNCGYYRVSLFKNKTRQRYLVHRLVAEHFIPNPFNKSIVNHKNECSYDNRVENLEWCDECYNQNYGTIRERKSHSRKVFERNRRLYI